jgi:hypothetical protein
MNERSHLFILPSAIASSSYSSRLRWGKRCWKSWQGMNERSHPFILRGAIASSILQQQIEAWQALLEKLGGRE